MNDETIEMHARSASNESSTSTNWRPAEPCRGGCGKLVHPGPRHLDRKYCSKDCKTRFEKLARRPKSLPGLGRKRCPRAEIGHAVLRELQYLQGRLGLDNWREALSYAIRIADERVTKEVRGE